MPRLGCFQMLYTSIPTVYTPYPPILNPVRYMRFVSILYLCVRSSYKLSNQFSLVQYKLSGHCGAAKMLSHVLFAILRVGISRVDSCLSAFHSFWVVSVNTDNWLWVLSVNFTYFYWVAYYVVIINRGN